MRIFCLIFGFIAATASAVAQHGVDIERYDVSVTPNFATKEINGSTRIVLRAAQNGVESFEVTANALTVSRIKGGTLAPSEDAAAWRIRLDRPLRKFERATVSFEYSGKPLRGLIFGDGIVYSSYFACDWMVCTQDRPGDKAALTLSLDLPPGMMSLGPGAMSRGTPAGPGLERHVWAERRPYSAYVFGFAAGQMTSTFLPSPGPALPVFSERGASDPERIQRMFATTGEMLAFFQGKAGVTFPHTRYVQLLVNGLEAQEASHFSIVGTQVIEPILSDPTEDWVIAHELAHQWWGNLITCADWSDFWLNEGIVTFMTAAWKEHKHGRAAYDRELDLARKRLAVAAQAGYDKPLAWKGQYPSLRIRRAVQYSKGTLFLDALRSELGDAVFWAGIKRFTQRHAGGIVTSHDLQKAFESVAEQSLDAIFRKWVTG